MKTIAIIDYGMCNLDSVARAVELCGGRPEILRQAAGLELADGIILPGVGAFPQAMRGLADRGLVTPIRHAALELRRPFLGICLGMQLMAEVGEEIETCAGLGLVPGRVVRLSLPSPEMRIPHVGWNEVRQQRANPLLEGIKDGQDFYFVHSYHFAAQDDFVLATTPYCGGFASVVGQGVLFGTQFHPEKSLAAGQTVLRNFLALC